jgi:hypothetical protein
MQGPEHAIRILMRLERYISRIIASILAAFLMQPLIIAGGYAASAGICAEIEDSPSKGVEVKVIFLHHSTGEVIWKGGMQDWFEEYNVDHEPRIQIEARHFPKGSPYPWNNYPFDYWNIWVNHAGENLFMDEPTLEILTRDYDVIIWKHCFPVCDIGPDTGEKDISSSCKSLENYKLQYEALKAKMRGFHDTKFIVWTGAAQVGKRSLKSRIKNFLKGRFHDRAGAERAREFFDWVKNEWDEEGDNIFIWDFYELETEGGLYLKEAYARKPTDSHPNVDFSRRVAPLLCRRIVDVIAGHGDTPNITGE